MNYRKSNTNFLHSVIISTISTVKMHNFSSTKLSKLYMNGYISPFVRIRKFRMTDDYFSMIDCVSNFSDVINIYGGLTGGVIYRPRNQWGGVFQYFW